MCGGLEYRYIDPKTGEIKTRKAFFPIPKVKIPVKTGETEPLAWCQWGKRHGEDPDIDVPTTGWARLLSLSEGKWNHFNPRRVTIPALRWMEKDAAKQSHWFEMEPGRGLLGVLIEQREQQFVYVVTQPASPEFFRIYQRMPMQVCTSDSPPASLCMPLPSEIASQAIAPQLSLLSHEKG